MLVSVPDEILYEILCMLNIAEHLRATQLCHSLHVAEAHLSAWRLRGARAKTVHASFRSWKTCKKKPRARVASWMRRRRGPRIAMFF